MWEYMDQFPERRQRLDYGLQVSSAAASWAVAMYPFREVLSQLETTEDTPLVVDIGGGKGHMLSRIKELIGDGVKGRFILQERQQVLDGITEELPGIERQEHNFFTPQPLKGAYLNSFMKPLKLLLTGSHIGAMIYYLRRCLHDWPDAVCVDILRNIAAGITDKTRQRVVIAEAVLPEKTADLEGVWMDITMITIAGTERTEKQWRKLLDEAGFRLSRTFVGGDSSYAAVEAFLK
jgi:hypothetical protein